MADFDAIEILLVEDNVYDRELTLRALARKNLTNNIFAVKDGAEALDFLFARGQFASRTNASSPRLILLDLKLPKVDGLDVLRHLKSDEAKRGIPVVILTSSAEEKDIIESYRLGVNSYIVKPVDFDKFVQAVSEVGLYWLLLNKTPKP